VNVWAPNGHLKQAKARAQAEVTNAPEDESEEFFVCEECEGEVSAEDKICPHCGRRFPDENVGRTKTTNASAGD
jgi:hypothetical protein